MIPAYIAVVQDPYLEPELAISCFESWTTLTVVVHDLGGALGPYLAPNRQWHVAAWCSAVKRSEHGHKCMNFDVERIRSELPSLPRGRIQMCHAGLVEVVVPVMRQGKLELILFAGQRSASADLRPVLDTALEGAGTLRMSLRPPAMSQAEAQLALEGLRQLGARLKAWLDDTLGSESLERLAEPKSRKHRILRFVMERHHQPIGLGDLAEVLGLSLHRTAHVVKGTFGRTFVQLLTESRLRSACALLQHTELTVPEVAKRSGFGDPDHFHRIFRRDLKTTPGRFRDQPVSEGP